MRQTIPADQGPDSETGQFIAAVRSGLKDQTQKTLDVRYLYDAVGSALFEVITLLPEYGVTRADERLIDRHAAELANHLGPDVVIAELGSGTGAKTQRIISALRGTKPLIYRPIDVSASALERCQRELRTFDHVELEPLQLSFFEGLEAAMARTPEDKRLLLLFLGGTIGNFDRPAVPEFLKDIRGILRPGDAFLLGTDLEKATSRLLAAYDDALGVTAAFNLNVLARINRELGGNFDVSQFEHVARYDEDERRIEMHLRALRDQQVGITAADIEISFEEGETIWTESSHKFNAAEIAELSEMSGFRCAAQWVDEEWPFAENLLVAE